MQYTDKRVLCSIENLVYSVKTFVII